MESVTSPSSFILEDNLTIAAVPALLNILKSAGDAPVSLDAGQVKHLDWPVLQVLLAAAKDRRLKDQPFQIENISENFLYGLKTLGVDLEAITSAEAA